MDDMRFSLEVSPRKLLLGLIGAGIQGSSSPMMHMGEAVANGLNCVYQLIDTDGLALTRESIPELLLAAERMGFAGVNVTHPYKQDVLPWLSCLSQEARDLGSVNTVVFQDGRRASHNTDWDGFMAGFNHGIPDACTDRVLQIGAGGAGSATAYGMLRQGAKHVSISDIDGKRSAALVGRLATLFGDDRVSICHDVAGAMRTSDGLIQATQVGMVGHLGTPLDLALLRRNLWVAEIIYFPLQTELLRAARAAGCRTVDGSGMVVHQAAKAFELFTGLSADPKRMRAHFEASLRER